MTKEQLGWGIDLGGTKIECTVLRQLPDRFEVVARERIPTEAHLGYQQILSQVAQLIRSISKEQSTAPVTVGIGHPGVVSPSTQLLKNSNTQCLNGMPLQQDR